MKVILCRIGETSQSAWGVPNPLWPEGGLCLLPPEEGGGRLRLREFSYNSKGLASQLEALGGAKGLARRGVSLNPDIDPASVERAPGWRPSFEISGDLRAHLLDQHIGEGDLVLFFAPFREILVEGGLRYRQEMPVKHCVCGWLQVGSIVDSDEAGNWPELPDWFDASVSGDAKPSPGPRSLYFAAQSLDIEGLRRQMRGGGVFRLFHLGLALSARNQDDPNLWDLPHWMYPASRGRPALSRHGDLDRWRKDGKSLFLTTASKQRAYVLNAPFYPESLEWLRSLFAYADLSD